MNRLATLLLAVFAVVLLFAVCRSQEPPITIQPERYPIPTPFDPSDQDGLDPVEQMRMRDRIKILELERRLARTERLARLQVRQIDQLQRITFGIGRPGGAGQAIGDAGPGAAPTPIGTPSDLIPKESESDE